MRDLGGWSCDGGTIQYGMLIRGGDTNPADKPLMVDEIGIRTEVRLFEKSAHGLDHSIWDIDMIVNPTNSVIAYSMDKAMWKPLLIGIFDSVSHNLPVYFHCGQGADRTGAMCAYSDSAGTTISGKLKTSKTEPQYTFDVSSSSYVRLGLVLSSSAISSEDTANLTIYGS